MQVVANRPHHHFPRVETHAHAQLQAPCAAHLLSIGLHGRLHGQGGIAGPQGVIFMGNGGAKERHDAIAEHLVHRALVAVHGVHHALEGRVEELLGVFGIETADQLHRVFEVGKQHRDLLAFAFQGTTGGEDLLGQIGGRVGQRRGRCGGGAVGAGGGERCGGAGPDQDFPLLIDAPGVGPR